jgi:hypothetical protein
MQLICLQVVNPQWMLRPVISQKDLMAFEIDSLTSHEESEDLPNRSFYAEIPKVDRPIPPTTCHKVVITRVPFQAKYSIVMLT